MDEVAFGVHRDRQRMVERARSAADAVWHSLLPGYGPHGGLRLLDLGDDVQLLRSAASGLNEQALDADMAPYQDLARSVRSAVGDGATTATLLAAGLVRNGLELEDSGVPRPVVVEGLRLARRQALAALRAATKPTTSIDALRHVTPLDSATVQVVLDGIQSLAEGSNHVDLDEVDVVVEAGATPSWASGTLVRPQHEPDRRRATDVGVLVVDGGWSMTSRTKEMVHRVRNPESLNDMRQSETLRRRAVLDRLLELGIGLLVCGGGVDESLCLDAARRGVWVWTDAPKTVRHRLAGATRATAVPDLDHVDGDSVGRADVRRRKPPLEGCWADGPSASATLVLPGGLPHGEASMHDEGERLLRAAGVVVTAPKGLPGGGQWQRLMAESLRNASVHAPGKHALVVEMVAGCLDRMADGLVRNAGHDPLTQPLLPGIQGVLDAAPCVKQAVDAGFEAAITILRVDARHDKRSSNPASLRGGTGPAGSPKGMPGDIPPLM